MIDPDKVTDFNRSALDLQEFFLFCCVVAGKPAHRQAVILDRLLEQLNDIYRGSHFHNIKADQRAGLLLQRITDSRIGQYNKLHKCFLDAANINPATCSIDDLRSVHGVGPKTARFFLMHSRPDQRFAALDTHLLKFLRANGISAPRSTPSDAKRYAGLEKEFLALADRSGMSVADFDLSIWKKYRRKAVEREA